MGKVKRYAIQPSPVATNKCYSSRALITSLCDAGGLLSVASGNGEAILVAGRICSVGALVVLNVTMRIKV